MISLKKVEELLPCPIKIEICCDFEEFKSVVQNSLKDLRLKHNKNYDTKIEYIRVQFIQADEDNDFSMKENKECRIFVGKDVVQYIKCPEINTNEISDKITQNISYYYWSIVNITEQILKIWHDKIIEVQKQNESKVKQFEQEGYDEILFSYYNLRTDKRAFFYLKKLAERYPNSKYMDRLKRVYRSGYWGWHRRNPEMATKLNKKFVHEFL